MDNYLLSAASEYVFTWNPPHSTTHHKWLSLLQPPRCRPYHTTKIYSIRHTYPGGRDRSVGIATHYRLDGPRIETRSRQHFPRPSIPAPRRNQPPIRLVPGLSWKVKRKGRGSDHPPPSSYTSATPRTNIEMSWG